MNPDEKKSDPKIVDTPSVSNPVPPVTPVPPVSTPVPPIPVPPVPIFTPLEETKETVREHPIKALRTYQGDVEETLAKNKLGTTTIFVAEQQRRQSMPVQDEAISTVVRNKSFIVLGAALLLLGTMFVGFVYYVNFNKQIEITKKTKALVSFSEEKVIPIANMTRTELTQKIISEKISWNQRPNDILYINTVGVNLQPASPIDLLRLLAPRMPASLSRSFEGNYMLGIYSFDTNEPFIILTTKDFPSSFEGMLRWEKDIITDLGELFSISQETPLNSPSFTDEALVNKDLRIIKNNENKIVLLYSFIDKNTLVITGSENVFTALIGRYLVTKQQQ